MTPCLRGFPFTSFAIALACMLTGATGCTSALTTASLRGLPWDTADTKADVADETAAVAADSDSDDSGDAEPAVDHDARRAAAIEEAITRLSKVGSLDEQAQATLMATLHNTAPEDWPVVVAEFTTALTKAGTDAAAPHVVAKAELSQPSPAPVPAAVTAPEPAATSDSEAAPEPPTPTTEVTAVAETDANAVAAPAPTAAPDAVPPPEPTATVEPARTASIRTACFASRVQAWGVFDRFPANRFTPGQEVIVYVELDDLAATTAADGHTTCIDPALRLVAANDRTLADWNFEPIAETCASRRRDYFARFVVRIPETAPAGRCHVALAITDTLAGKTVETTLPLEIAPD
jgi:hypothetical protein